MTDGFAYTGTKRAAYDVYNLQENQVIEGDLDLRGTSITHLPAGLKVKGTVFFNNRIRELPEGFSAGYIDLIGTNVARISANSSFGWLRLNGKVRALPKDLKIIKNAGLRGNVESMSDLSDVWLKVRHLGKTNSPVELRLGTLVLNNTVKALPDDLIADYLDLRGTKISDIPAYGKFANTLIAGERIKNIPTTAEIKNLDLRFSAVRSLSDGTTIKGKLLLNNIIHKLPRNLYAGILDLSNTAVKELSSGLRVSTLTLNDRIKSVPSNVAVNWLYMGKSKIKALPDDFKLYKSLYFSRYTKLQSVPFGVKDNALYGLSASHIKRLRNNYIAMDIRKHNKEFGLGRRNIVRTFFNNVLHNPLTNILFAGRFAQNSRC